MLNITALSRLTRSKISRRKENRCWRIKGVKYSNATKKKKASDQASKDEGIQSNHVCDRTLAMGAKRKRARSRSGDVKRRNVEIASGTFWKMRQPLTRVRLAGFCTANRALNGVCPLYFISSTTLLVSVKYDERLKLFTQYIHIFLINSLEDWYVVHVFPRVVLALVPGTPQEERSENSVNTSIVAVKLYSMKLEQRPTAKSD